MNFHAWRGQIIARMRSVARVPILGDTWIMENGVPFHVDVVTGIPLGDPEPDYYVLAGKCRWPNGEIGNGVSMVRLSESLGRLAPANPSEPARKETAEAIVI